MVTVAVIAVILVIGVPSIANMKRSADLTTASKELVTALNYARAEAVRQGAGVSVANRGAGWGDGWRVELASDNSLIRNFDKPPTGSTVALTTGSAPVTFVGLGNVSAASCFDITVTGTSSVRSINIASAGRVTTNKTACP